MAFDASPPIISKYTRESRPKTPVQSRPTDDLDESSLAAWWNIDKTINLNNNTTPFRKQRYEPLKWANAHLLLDEDGGDFLADDPFATPAPRLKSAKKLSSARKRNSNAAAGYPKSSSRMSVGSHRDLTLADLTPRSRRLSGFRTNTIHRSRVSDAIARPLRLSFNGPSFTANPHQELEMIQEQNSRQIASPALRRLNPERPPISPSKTAAPSPTRQPRLSAPKDVASGVYHKRESGRGSIPSAQGLHNEKSDDEELHKSIPGAFDFVALERFQPKPALPNEVLEQKAPRRSNAKEMSKSRSSTGPSHPTNGGLAGMLAEYGNSLMGLLGPIPTQSVAPQRARSSASLKLSELSPRKPAAIRPSLSHETTSNARPTGKASKTTAVSKAAIPRSPRKPVPPVSLLPSPAKPRPSTKAPVAPCVHATSRLQKPSHGQFSAKPLSGSSNGPAPVTVVTTRVKEHTLDRPVVSHQTKMAGRGSPPPQQSERPSPRSSSRPRISCTVQSEAPPATQVSQLEEMATPAEPSELSHRIVEFHNTRHARRSETSGTTKASTKRASHVPSPSPQRMRFDPTSPSPLPTKRVVPVASPVKSRSSTSWPTVNSSCAVVDVPVLIVHVPSNNVPPAVTATVEAQPARRALRPTLKKRSLELSPAKVALDGRAKKRQKVSDTVVAAVKDSVLSRPAEHRVAAAERGQVAVSRKTKVEQAPRKQPVRSRSRINEEVAVVGPLILPSVVASPEQRPSRLRSHGHEAELPGQGKDWNRPRSRPPHREDIIMHVTTHGPLDGLQEDVFGTVMENSLEVINATKPTPWDALPPTVLESMSPIQRQEKHIHVPQHQQEHGFANDHQRARQSPPMLQPSTTHNSPKRVRPPVARKPPSPVHIDHRPQSTEYFDENSFVARPKRVNRDEGVCRLTIPVSPKFTHIRRERVREERERPVKPITERATRAKQREMPPVAAALLAKLAGVEVDLTSHQSRGKAAQSNAYSFTFKPDLRPALGRDAAVLADRALKQQFESRRNLWEQRSLEASQESRPSSLGHSRPASAQPARHGQEAPQVRQGDRYPLATSSRAAQREARRDYRRREGVQREERLMRVPRNHPSGGRDNRPW